MDLSPCYFVMIAKFDSKCHETGKVIKRGDKIAYLKQVKGVCGGRAFCKDSKLYDEAVNSFKTSYNI